MPTIFQVLRHRIVPPIQIRGRIRGKGVIITLFHLRDGGKNGWEKYFCESEWGDLQVSTPRPQRPARVSRGAHFGCYDKHPFSGPANFFKAFALGCHSWKYYKIYKKKLKCIFLILKFKQNIIKWISLFKWIFFIFVLWIESISFKL